MADFSFSELNPARSYLHQIADFLTERPHAWCRGQFAVDAEGRSCDPRSPAAMRWCAIGLLLKFIEDASTRRTCELLLSQTITPRDSSQELSPANFNDNRARGVEDVIAMFRSAAQATRLELSRCSCPACTGEYQAMAFSLKLAPDWLKFATAANDSPVKEEAVAA